MLLRATELLSPLLPQVRVVAGIMQPRKVVWKVIPVSQMEMVYQTGFIPAQPDDAPKYIYAVDYDSINTVVRRFYGFEETVVLPISIEQAVREGFKIEYKTNGFSTAKNWYLGREDPAQLLSIKCVD